MRAPHVPFFDINVALGRFARPAGGSFDTTEALLAEMERFGISQALVYHSVAAEADVEHGNALLLQQLGGHPQLYPCWIMAPPYLHDLPAPDRWIRDALDAGVKAVRLLPRHHLYTVDPACTLHLLTELERARLPVLLDFGPRHWSETTIPWLELTRAADAAPSLPLILLGATVGDVRNLLPILQRTPNLYVEFHALNPPELLEQVVQTGLGGRLMFGTGLPRRAAECVVYQTLRAAVNDSELADMSGGTARRLLGVPPPDRLPSATPEPRLDMPIIDIHAHIGSWERTTTPIKGPDAFVRSMDRCQIDKMVFSSFTAIHGETRIGNRETAEAVRAHPDRLFGYCVANPNYPADTEADLKLHFEHATNFVGLKFHCQLHGAQLHDPGYEGALEFADAHELPVLVHGGGQDNWDEVAARYPRAAFIMAHACAWDGLDPAGQAFYARVRDIPNLYVDVSGSPAHRGALRALVKLVGAEKILYGSDFPMFDLAFEVGRVLLSDLPLDDKRLIAGRNAARVFKRLGSA